MPRLRYNVYSLAPVAQLDRASVFGTEGWGFESLREYFSKPFGLSRAIKIISHHRKNVLHSLHPDLAQLKTPSKTLVFCHKLALIAVIAC